MHLDYKRIKYNTKVINKKYKRMLCRYGSYINNEDKNYLKLFFSIMIMENYNRPWYLRILEIIIFIYRKIRYGVASMTLGIMQTKTNKIIGNVTSIKMAQKLIDDVIKRGDYINEKEKVIAVALAYNPSKLYREEILKIYDSIL